MTGAHGLDPALDVRLGGRRASLSLHDLATASGIPVARLRGVLLSFLLTSRHHEGAALPHPPSLETTDEGEATEGEPERSRRSPTFPKDKKGPETFGTPEPERPDAREGTHADGTLAAHLARSLGDEANLRGLERLVAGHPEALLRRALAVTLRVPAGRIRSSRGAYFTGVVRRLLTNSPDPHDRTHPAPP